jgi:hypothetical protein
MENLNIATKLRYGAPWGDGYIKSTNIGGTGHFARNNKVFEILWPSLTNHTSWRAEGEEPEYLEDTSYYHAQRPDFIPEDNWPFDAFDTDTRNPAAARYESGGPMTVTAGFSSYLLTSINDFVLDEQLLVYPNPCKGSFHLRYRMPDTRCRMPDTRCQIVELYSVSGNLIGRLMDQKQLPGEHEIEFDTRDLPAGLYYLKLQFGKQVLVRKLIIKN